MLNHTSAVPIAHLPLEMDYPELRVQHYRGRLALVSNSLLYSDSTVLPPSFRYPLEVNRNNPRDTAGTLSSITVCSCPRRSPRGGRRHAGRASPDRVAAGGGVPARRSSSCRRVTGRHGGVPHRVVRHRVASP